MPGFLFHTGKPSKCTRISFAVLDAQLSSVLSATVTVRARLMCVCEVS